MQSEPLKPRITKSQSTTAIRARFDSDEAVLKRFEIAKEAANLWDGERDGLREVVKSMDGGRYGQMLLSWSTSSPVMYPNAEGKHQIESCLQTSIPATDLPAGTPCLALAWPAESPEELLDGILRALQVSKQAALGFLSAAWLGIGSIQPNHSLFERKGSEKATITVLPDDFN